MKVKTKQKETKQNQMDRNAMEPNTMERNRMVWNETFVRFIGSFIPSSCLNFSSYWFSSWCDSIVVGVVSSVFVGAVIISGVPFFASLRFIFHIGLLSTVSWIGPMDYRAGGS